MTSRYLRRIRLTGSVLAVAGLGSCVAPILTVPPPGAADIAFSAAGSGFDGGAAVDGGLAADGGAPTLWTARGGPLPAAALATYYLRNRKLEEGVFATAQADGSFTSPPLEGALEDQIQIYYVTPAGNYSESICVLLTDGSSPPVCPE
jgi:hypothetical protein